MLRILQVTQYLQIGGLETLVVQMCCRLKSIGVEVTLLCFNDPDPQYTNILKESGVKLHVIQEKCRLNLCFFRKVADFIHRNSFHVVHAHSGCHLNTVIAAKMAGVKTIVYTAHGLPIFTSLKDRIEDSLAALFTDHVVSVSTEIASFLRKWLCFSRCDFKTIINGVDTHKFAPLVDPDKKIKLLAKYKLPTRRILFGSVGRLAPEKNYSMVLRVVRRLLDDGYENIGFVLVGDGEQKQILLDLANELGILDNIYFLGIQYDVHEILPLWRFFVLASVTEGTSISLLEAQACGIPAVATDVGGNSFVVDDMVNGFLCPSNNEEKMAECMKIFLNDHDKSRKFGFKGRERVQKDFCMDSVTRKYLQIYESAVLELNIKHD